VSQVPDTTDDRPDGYRCARHTRCADRVKETREDDTKHWVGARIEQHRGLCVSCTRHLSQAIPKLPMDYVELTSLLGVAGAGSDDNVRFSRELPIPIRLAIKTLQEQVVSETSTWVAPVAEVHGMDWLSTTEESMSRPQYRVVRACRILTNTVPALLRLGAQEVSAWDSQGMPVWDEEFDCQDTVMLDGVDGALRLLRLHELIKVVSGRGELTHRLPAPCPRCERLALVRDNGTSEVYCKACGDRWGEDDYKRLCLVLTSEEQLKIRNCKRCDRKGRLPKRLPCAHPAELAAA
jgi:hypothetical protein